MLNKMIEKWNGYQEDKIQVLFFLAILLAGIVTMLFMVPFLISAKSTFLVILGALTPFGFALFIYNLYRIFFIESANQAEDDPYGWDD